MGKRGMILAAAAVLLLGAALLWHPVPPDRTSSHGVAKAVPPADTSAREEGAPEDDASSNQVVFGRVVEAATGAPIAGATVSVIPGGADGATDGEGGFEIEGRHGSFVRCAVSARGFRMTLGPWLGFEGVRLDAGTIRLGGGLRLKGRVVDASGAGVAGADIRLEREGIASEEWAALLEQFGWQEAGDDGRFSFEGLDDALFRISVSVYDPNERDDVRHTKEHLRPGGEDVIFVVPFARRPVAGAISVMVTLPDGSALPRGTFYAGVAETASSELIEDGKATAKVEGSGPAWFAVLYPRDGDGEPLPYRPTLRMDVRPREEPYAITLEPGETIEGVVVAADGSPLAASVTITPHRLDADVPLMFYDNLQVRCGDDGRFRFVDLTPGEHAFHATCAGYTGVRPFVVARTGMSDVRIEMRRAARIRVHVVAPEGELLGGGSFTLLSRGTAGYAENGTQTVSIGRMSSSSSIETSFDGLREGEIYRIRASISRRGGGRYAPVEIDAVAGQADAVEVRLLPGRSLKGRVVRTGASPVAAAEVRVRVPTPAGQDEHQHYAADHGQAYTKSGLDGRFELRGVPEGGFWLTCEAGGLMQPEGPLAVGGSDTEIEIRMEPALEVSGRITGEQPLDFRIDWTPLGVVGEAATIPRDWQSSGADGFFALRGLAPGTLTIDGWRPWADDDRYVHAEGVEAGASDLRLPVLQGCRLEGTVEDRDGQPVAMAHVFIEAPWGVRRATTDEDGHFVLHALPPGRHLVRVATEQGAGEATAADAPGPPIRLVR